MPHFEKTSIWNRLDLPSERQQRILSASDIVTEYRHDFHMMKKTRLLPDGIKRLPVLPGSRSLTPAEFKTYAKNCSQKSNLQIWQEAVC
jgi:hypothetical protein